MTQTTSKNVREATATAEPYRVYLDSGQIVKLNRATQERHTIYPKALLNAIRCGNLAPFWDEKAVLDLLEEVLPSARYPRTKP